MTRKDLNQELFDEPYRFDFFQAVRLLERIFPNRKPLGGAALPNQEIIRIRSRMALDFPASQIHEITETTDEQAEETRHEMIVNFMGLTGPSGVLPIRYTELLIDRARYHDTAMWSFLDIYTHRAVSLFYRAWEKYRFPVQYERGNDQFTGYLFDFVGLGTDGLKNRQAVEDETLLPYAGLLAQKPHSSVSLEQMIADYFEIDAKVEQFFGQWIELDDESITRIGTANNKLGYTAIAGTRVWDQQSKFRLRLGGLPFQKFQAFLPNGSANEPLKSIVKLMTGQELDFDVQLVLDARQVPSCILTTRALRRPMLGWSSWLKTEAFTTDDEQVVLQVS